MRQPDVAAATRALLAMHEPAADMSGLTHLDEQGPRPHGRCRRPRTRPSASPSPPAACSCSAATLDLIRAGGIAEGRRAGGRRGSPASWRPSARPISFRCAIRCRSPRSRSSSPATAARARVEITATCSITGRTGVEMEALTAVVGRGAHGLRHVQGGRSRHAHHRYPPAAQIGRQVRRPTRRRDDLGRGSARAAAGAARGRSGAEQVSLAEARRPRARRGCASRAAPSRLSRSRRWTAMPCAPPTWRRVPARAAESSARCRRGRPMTAAGRSRRGGAHLHRRAGARRRRLHRHPGRHRARRRHRRRASEGAARGPLCPAGRTRFPRRRGRPHGRAPPHRARCRARRGDEPALAPGAPPAARRDPADRRRGGDARRSRRAQSDRQLQRAWRWARWSSGLRRPSPVQLPIAPDDSAALQRIADGAPRRRSPGHHRRRLGRRARSGARRAGRRPASRSISGRWRCGRASR